MTRDDVLKALSSGSQIVIDAPMHVATTGNDAVAGDLLTWLFDRLPEAATWRDAHDVLDAAKWWTTLLEATRGDE
jgi:hypothetical protein